MPSIQVINTPPEHDPTVSGDELHLFRKIISAENAYPFTHQSRAFQLIRAGEECVLVAGTAAGKTLAVVIPLLLRAKHGHSQKVMFLYPALALLEDQLETIRKAASFLQLNDQVGYIYGGMTRQELISQLNKKIIVATPDAVYWFLEKNVKYSSVLYYALCHVDDVVLDEAHLLSGLMGFNIKAFLDRLSEIRQTFLQKGKFRTHILTATPTEVISTLSNGEMIYGRSKVGAVQFEFAPPQHAIDWGDTIQEEVERGFHRMLLVLNAASTAHLVFLEQTVGDDHPALRAFYPEFGFSSIGDVIRFMLACDFDRRQVANWATSFLETEKVPLHALDDTKTVALQLETVLEQGLEAIRHTKNHQLDPQLWEEFVAERFQEEQTQTATVKEWKGWLQQLKHQPSFHQLFANLERSFLNMKLPLSATQLVVSDLSQLQKPQLHLKVLEKECRKHNFSFKLLEQKLVQQRAVQLPKYISLLKGTDIPVILYTGSMPKRARRGLIQAFQSSAAPQAIMISTSAVEVGVDFNVDLLVTEACVGSSFLQRFGRIGRRGGGQQRVRLVTRDGSVTGKLQEFLADKQTMTREEFSELIQSVMKKRHYFSTSPYLELLHHHVTRRIGEAGRVLAPETDPLELTILEKGGFRYGLRSTIPQVELLDEGIGRDPFQILGYLSQNELHVTASPFSVARADVFFDSLIYRPRQANVLVEQISTLRYMKLFLFYHQGKLHVLDPCLLLRSADQNKDFDYRKTAHFQLHNQKIVESLLRNSHPTAQSLKPYLEALQANRNLNRYILGLGDVYLTKVHAGGGQSIRDAEGQDIVLKDQMFLIQTNYEDQNKSFKNEVEKWYDYEQELIVNSYQSYERKYLGGGAQAIGHIALDRVAGACVELYKELVHS